MVTKFSFADGSDRRVPAQIRAALPVVISAIAQRITWWMLRLQQKIQGEKLQGQVLQHRSGRLAASINARPTEQTGSELVGTVEGAGGPAWYGQIHELGGQRAYEILPVNKKALAFFPAGGPANAKAIVRGLRAGKGGSIAQFAAAGGVVVKGVIHPALKQRSFMSSALQEIQDAMLADLQSAAGLSVQ
jgi:phage gpG-like protein